MPLMLAVYRDRVGGSVAWKVGVAVLVVGMVGGCGGDGVGDEGRGRGDDEGVRVARGVAGRWRLG
jgi:hypothetical protein